MHEEEGPAGMIGRSLPRLEDARFLTGRGTYLDDLDMAGLCHAAVARSPVASARLRAVDVSGAADAPGVLGVLTAEALRREGVTVVPLELPPPGPAADDPDWLPPEQPVLAGDRVRFVGEPVAFVFAETAAQARDAAERVIIDFEDLPAVVDTASSAGHATAVDASFPDNTLFTHELGDEEAVAAAFAGAAHVARIEMVNNRVYAAALEPRGCIGEYDPDSGCHTLRLGTQRPHNLQRALADHVFGVPRAKVRVVGLDTGGGFGMKNGLYPEYILCLLAARLLGRPVKWVADRAEGLLADNHGRDNVFTAEAAMDGNGRLLGIRAERFLNIGAYTAPRTMVPAWNGLAHLTGVYDVPAAHIKVTGVLTNTASTSVYRGAGRPEAVMCCERLIDYAARDIGADPVNFRYRNLITKASMPKTTALDATYDGLDFERILDHALERADRDGFDARRRSAEGAGLRRGLGMALFVEGLHGSPEPAPAAIFLDDGTLSVSAATMSTGHSHETTFAQIAADRLGLPLERLRFVQGDTAVIPDGIGTGGSWSLTLGGSSVRLAADAAIERGRDIAAGLMEAAPADVAFAGGIFRIVGTDRTVGWDAVLAKETAFRVDAVFDEHGENCPVGCHVCEVEVDPATGAVRLDRYSVVQDSGTLINPMVVAGQVHGGVAQGIGQAWLESIIYEPDSGQLLTGSFMDYGVPRADDLPSIDTSLEETPDPNNPLGVKGVGEAGATGAAPAFVNAVIDALAPLGVKNIDMPLTPERVWRAIRSADKA
mgnify:CR=1 FL=1